METLFQILTRVGYPPEGVDWLRQRRGLTIVILALAAWALFIAVGWMIWSILT